MGEHGEWTADSLCDRVAVAYRVLRRATIYSPARGVLLPVEGADLTHLQVLEAVDRLPQDLRVVLLMWARCIATGVSIRAYCDDHGIVRGTFYRHRKEGAELVVEAILRGRHPYNP